MIRAKNLKKPKPSKGQITVEFILMLALTVVFWQAFVNTIKNSGHFDDFVEWPNQLIGHMIANGNWRSNPSDSKDGHPNRYGRRWSWDP